MLVSGESYVFLVVCRANAGVTSDAESITESLRRSRQLMVQVRKISYDQILFLFRLKTKN